MASTWKLGGNDIYVTEYTEKKETVVAEVVPINANGSTYHVIATPDKPIKFGGYVVGESNKNTILDLDGTETTLTTDQVTVSGILLGPEAKRDPATCQYIDPLQATTAPVYFITGEFKISP